MIIKSKFFKTVHDIEVGMGEGSSVSHAQLNAMYKEKMYVLNIKLKIFLSCVVAIDPIYIHACIYPRTCRAEGTI